MSTQPARSRSLLFLGILINLVIFPLNHIVGLVVNHGDYTPFAVAPQVSAQVYDETQAYVPVPSRFFRTGQIEVELDVYELRNSPNSYPVAHSVLLGLLAKAVGSLERGWMLSHAIGPTLIWAVLFWIACGFVGSGPLAMAISWAVCFIAFGPRNFLLVAKDSFIQPLELTRMPQPGLAFLFLILAIWLLARALAKPNFIRILAAGILAGSLFYIYYFYWIAFFAGAGSLSVALFVIGQRTYAKSTAFVIGLGCLVGIPFFVWTVEATRAGHQRDLMMRVGAFTRSPHWIGIALAVLLAVALWFYCRMRIHSQPYEKTDAQPLFAAVLLATALGAAIGNNFQVLTGFDAQHDHFYNRALQPLLGYFFLLMLFRNVRRPPVAAVIAVIAALLGVAARRQIEVGKNTAPYQRKSNPDMDVLIWARSHLSSDAVIGSNDGNLLTMIPAIDGVWTFVPRGDRSMASSEEILTRYLLLCRLEGWNWQKVEDDLQSDSHQHPNASPIVYTLITAHKLLPESQAMARTIWGKIDLATDFRDRRLDYLMERKDEGAPVFPTRQEPFSELYENSAWRLFRVPQR
ncbi:MAG TPA: hypothetical protein VGL82_03770 [Bryobacteraceae bacterium]